MTHSHIGVPASGSSVGGDIEGNSTPMPLMDSRASPIENQNQSPEPTTIGIASEASASASVSVSSEVVPSTSTRLPTLASSADDAPPSYAEARTPLLNRFSLDPPHPFEASRGFPSGVFMLSNRSNGKVLDVRNLGTNPGTEIVAYTAKKPSLQDGQMLHKTNNQLFFLDWHGTLCAANCQRPVDVRESKLYISTPMPICAIPSSYSRPPPTFHYDHVTMTISLRFMYDPTFAGDQSGHHMDYLLETVPEKQLDPPPSAGGAFTRFTDWLPFVKAPTTPKASMPVPLAPRSSTESQSAEGMDHTPLTGSGTLSSSAHTFDTDFDNSWQPMRNVRVATVPIGWREKMPREGSVGARVWKTRQWEVVSLVSRLHRHGDSTPIPSIAAAASGRGNLGELEQDIWNNEQSSMVTPAEAYPDGDVNGCTPFSESSGSSHSLSRSHRTRSRPRELYVSVEEEVATHDDMDGLLDVGEEDARPLTPRVIDDIGGRFGDIGNEAVKAFYRRST